ncbi:hypothetical protein HN51_047408, partial [Arachis hypogaea]
MKVLHFILLHGKVAAISEGIEQLCEKVRVKGNCSSQDDYYPHLARAVYSTLNYVVPETDEK